MRRFSPTILVLASALIGLHILLPLTGAVCKLSSQEVAQKVLPSIVQIGIAESGSVEVRTVGTGMLVDKAGWILTARHNVASSSKVFIKFSSDETFQIVTYIVDAKHDLALLRFDPNILGWTTLKPLTVSKKPVKPGEEIMAFGFPAYSAIRGLYATISKGVVSAVDRVVYEPGLPEHIEKDRKPSSKDEAERAALDHAMEEKVGIKPTVHMIQTDAMVNPGSSGGAIVNMDGEIVGVTNSIISTTGSNIGLNFAVPIKEAKALFEAAGLKWEDEIQPEEDR